MHRHNRYRWCGAFFVLSAFAFSAFAEVLGVPKLSAPSNGATNLPITVTLSWSSATSSVPTTYEVFVSTSATFSDVWTSSVSGTSAAPSCVSNTTYYWEVRVFDAQSNLGSWSGVWSFTTAPEVLGVPTLSAPSDGAANQPTTVTLSWSSAASSVPTTYEVFISTSAAFDSVGTSSVSGTSAVASGANNTTYYWEVRVLDAQGNPGSWSGVWSFTTAPEALGVPTLSAPSDGAANQPTTVILSWSSATSSVPTTYEVFVSTSTAFSPVGTSSANGTSAGVSGANNTTYYWEVRVLDAQGNPGSWSGVWSFTTASEMLGVPTLSAPSDGAPNQPATVTLSWSSATSSVPTTYEVFVSTSSAFSPVWTPSVSGASAGVSGANNTTYYWEVRVLDAQGNPGSWSGVWSFTTALNGLGAPTLSAPSNGATSQLTTVTLSWSSAMSAVPLTYEVFVSTSSTFSPVWTPSVSGTSAVVSCANNTTYYWEVRELDAQNDSGSWSGVWSFTTPSDTSSAVLPTRRAFPGTTAFTFRSGAVVYSLARASAVELSFSDMLGRTAMAVNRKQEAGFYTVALRDCNLASGRYIVRFKAPGAGIDKRVAVVLTR
ncbi:MAG: hypothetical protein ABSE00_06430 [Chitinispirillaceae bacterium]|jgi:hypothetical protein